MRLLALAALGGFAAVTDARRAPGETRPNIIFFFPDTIRAESLSPYGHPLVSTPNMERLASEAVLFDEAHAQHSQCSPSRAALVTGRYMHVLGHRTQTHLVQPYEDNMWALLKAAGYTTITLGKNDALSAASFNASFSYWEGDIGVSREHREGRLCCSGLDLALGSQPARRADRPIAEGKNPYAFGDAGYYSFASTSGAANGSNVQANGDLKAVKARVSRLLV